MTKGRKKKIFFVLNYKGVLDLFESLYRKSMHNLNGIFFIILISLFVSCNNVKESLLSKNFEERCSEFIQLNDGCGGAKDTFLWFTDPHLFYAGWIDEQMRELEMTHLEKCNNLLFLDFVLC